MSISAAHGASDGSIASHFPLTAREIVYLAALAVLATYFTAWPIWRAQFLVEIWPTEGWNAYWQDAAAAGLRLYPPADALTLNNYPPLSFYALGYLGRLFGDNLFVGRAISIIGLIVVAIEIFAIIQILGERIAGAAVGALWYLAIMARNSTTYIGANDPQLAGQAIMGAGLVWLLLRDRKGKSPLPTLLLMVVAGFWKHNMIGIPLTSAVWLLARRGRNVVFPILASGLAALAGLGLCVALHGFDFVSNLLATRQYAWANVLTNVGHLQWSAIALAIWASWAWSDRDSPAARFSALHISIGLSACLLQWFGHGVSGNAEFDFLIALGVGVGLAFSRIHTSWLASRIGVGRSRDMMIAILLLRLIAAERQETLLVMLSPEFRSKFQDGEKVSRIEADQIARTRGDVACSNKVVCRAAGKPFVVDEFKMEELVATAKATAEDVDWMIAAAGIIAFKNDARTTADAETSILRAPRSQSSMQ